MQWDDLRIFLAVARAGSISGGARQLGVQHSTVSRRIRSLEEKLGARLIERKRSGYELTAAGEELKLAAGKMEIEALQVEDAVSGRSMRVAGELRVSAINNMASGVLMPVFAAFTERYPDINLRIEVSNRYVSLAERHADIVLRLTNTPLDTLVGLRLVTVRSAVYGRCDYVRELRAGAAKERWIGVDCCDFHRSWTEARCPDRDHSFTVDDTLLTIAALRQGLGLAYLPCFMGDSDEALARHCPPDPAHDLGLWLLYHPDLRRIKRVRVFRQHMIEKMATLEALMEGRQEAS